MKMHMILSILALLAIAAPFLIANLKGGREEVCNVNANVGTHPTGVVPKVCQTAALTRYQLVQQGTADNQIIANVATTRPWGVVLDEPAVGDTAAVALLGATNGTLKMVANAAVTVGTVVYTAAAGKVSPTFGATLYMVGRALTPASADGDIIEVQPCFPLLNSATL